MALVCAELDVESLLVDLAAIADVLQPVNLIAEDT